jgi:hypothetical protein
LVVNVSGWKIGVIGVLMWLAGCSDAGPSDGRGPSDNTSGGTAGTTSSGMDGGAIAGSGGSGTGGAAGAAGATSGGTGGSGGTAATGGTDGGASGSGGATTVYLSDLCTAGTPTNGWGPIERDLSNGEQAEGDGGPLTIAHEVYSKGIGVHAPADIAFTLGAQCSTFSAWVGIDDEARSAGSVVFEVWGDGARLYQSGIVTGVDGALPVQVDVTGIQELRLVTSDNGGSGSDHADWAEARVTCSDAPTTECSRREPEVSVPPGYTLIWADEFDVEGPPSSDNWDYERGFVRNEELQWYQEDNAWVQAGFLIIEGRRERVANPNYQAASGDWKTNRQYAEYTSAALHSRGRRSFQYGRFEVRARIVAEPGLWPAIWTLGNSGEWPSNGEIDIMEYYNGRIHANVASGTTTRWVARWDSANREVSSFGDDDWDAKFHLWRMDWNDQTITLWLDGAQMNTTRLDDMLNPDSRSPFRQPHYLLLNLAIGGTAGGDPSGTEFPSRYEIDYVRVFQQP